MLTAAASIFLLIVYACTQWEREHKTAHRKEQEKKIIQVETRKSLRGASDR